MAWDFETDPEFQAKLDWMETFVTKKVEPLGYLGIHPYDVKNERRNALVRPLQDEVKHQALWACHLGPELRGQGYGQVKLGLMDEALEPEVMADIERTLGGFTHRTIRFDHISSRRSGRRRLSGPIPPSHFYTLGVRPPGHSNRPSSSRRARISCSWTPTSSTTRALRFPT